MHFLKRMLTVMFVVVNICGTVANAAIYDFEETGIVNLEIADSFSVATRNGCDEIFEDYLRNLGYNFRQWQENVLTKEKIYAYGVNKSGDILTMRCRMIDFEAEDLASGKTNQYMYDYNILLDNTQRGVILTNYVTTLHQAGVNPKYIIGLEWAEFENPTPTPYFWCEYLSGDTYIYEYHTIYGGYDINIALSSPTAISEKKREQFEKSVQNVAYTYDIDYTDAIALITKISADKQNRTIESAQTTIRVRAIYAICLGLMLSFCIYITIRKLKKKKKH